MLVLDPHSVARDGVVHTIERDGDFVICGAVATAADALQAIPVLEPDILTLELALDHGDGLELIKNLRALHPKLRTLVITGLREDQFAERALRAGAAGFVEKARPSTCILHALHAITEGGVWFSSEITTRLLQERPTSGARAQRCPLTDRELQVYRLIGTGLRTGEIAQELGVSVKTVETYRANIKAKLKVQDGAELLRRAQEWIQHGCAQCACSLGRGGSLPEGHGYCTALFGP